MKNGGSTSYGAVTNTGHLMMLGTSTVKSNTGYTSVFDGGGLGLGLRFTSTQS